MQLPQLDAAAASIENARRECPQPIARTVNMVCGVDLECTSYSRRGSYRRQTVDTRLVDSARQLLRWNRSLIDAG
jgi:hypothetical protein